MSSDPVDLDKAYAFAKDLAIAAGQKLLDSLEERRTGAASSVVSSTEKANAVDIVTATDEAVERFIHDRITATYPTHDFIGEETYAAQTSAHAAGSKPYLIRNDTPAWCVDPLDGTVNYVHGFPCFAVSIALIVGGKPVVGAISIPFNSQLFHGCKGRGAWLSLLSGGPGAAVSEEGLDSISISGSGGSGTGSESGTGVGVGAGSGAGSGSEEQQEPTHRQRVHVLQPNLPKITRTMRLPLMGSPIPALPDNAPTGCLFAFEWGKDRRSSPTSNLSRKVSSFVNMASELGSRDGKGAMVHGMRSLGSATLDMAYTALGSVDVWWEGGCWEWDVAAGWAILVEAGGIVVGGNPPGGDSDGVLDGEGRIREAKLGGRSYLAIRPVGVNERGESGRVQQERLVREVWKRVNALDYSRPGA